MTDPPRFVQVDADRAYLVRVVLVPNGTHGAIGGGWTADETLHEVKRALARLAVERVWLQKCPMWAPGSANHEPCSNCESSPSPKRGWVVEVCEHASCLDGKIYSPDTTTIDPGHNVQVTSCIYCHGTGEHVERMGLVEALDRGRNGVGWHLSESSRTELARQGGEERYGLAIDALALLTEGAEQ